MVIDPKNTALYNQTFFRYATAATDRVQSIGSRFVYYTTAATAIQILRNREIWMRNTLVMNDVMEVEHGLNCLVAAYDSDAGRTLNAALDACFTGISAEIKTLFNGWIPVFRRDTFVACFSEHPPEEDAHGRLSMWRAYGGTAGVALVLNGGVLLRPSRALAAYSSPVAYLDAAGVQAELAAVAAKVQTNHQFVHGLGREVLKNAIFLMLRFAAICTKHPAFKEEREWRVVASPAFEPSTLLPAHVEVIGAVPQTVLKIKLEDHSDQGLYGLTPPDLLERVLIGPCDHPEVLRRALHQVLIDVGVPSPELKIHDTGIPLRANQR